MIGRRFLLAMLVCLGLSMCGCEENGDGLTIEYVLPDGYTGYFWIIVDQGQGEEIGIHNSEVTIRVPPDGILKVKDDGFLTDWHKATAKSYSGDPIKVEPFDSTSADDQALRSLSSSSEGIHTFVIGPQSVVDEYNSPTGSGVWEAREELQERLKKR